MATLLAPKMQTQEPPLPHEVGCEVFHGLDLHENFISVQTADCSCNYAPFPCIYTRKRLCKPIERSKSPGRQGPPDPTGAAYSATPDPLAGGKWAHPLLKNLAPLGPSSVALRLFRHRHFCGRHDVVHGLAPCN